MFKYLVQEGADINALSRANVSVIAHATANVQKEMVLLLLNKGANLNTTQGDGCATGFTALNWAILNGWEDVVEKMLPKQDLSLVDREHPLISARFSFEMINFLVKKDIKPNTDVIEYYTELKQNTDPSVVFMVEIAKKALVLFDSIPMSASSKLKTKKVVVAKPMSKFEKIEVTNEKEMIKRFSKK